MNGDELGRTPIRPEAPTGEDVRDQDIFLDLQAEVNRAQSLSSGTRTAVDWPNVRKMATSILESKSKDLLVAAYLSVALSRIEGPPGVLDGISLLKAMVSEHWDGLFPPGGRIRARRNAFSWWISQMQEILPAVSGPALSPEALGKGIEEIRELNATLGEKDQEGPSLAPLFPLIEGLPVSLPEAPPEPSSASPEKPESSGRDSASGDRFSLSGTGDPAEALEAISPALLTLAGRLSDVDPADSRALFLSRTVLWEGIREIPESEGMVTRIPPPPPHLLSTLEVLSASGSDEEILRFLLSRQAEVPFWFELSFRAAQILKDGGPSGAGAAEALRGSFRALVARLPGIERLSFSGGQILFLSEEGRSWAVQGANAQESGGGEERARASVLSKVRSALSEGRILEACDLFEEIRRKESSPRERFLLNLELLLAVEQMGRDFPVLSLAMVLLEDIERFHLNVWEPALAARALPALYRIFLPNEDEALRRRADALGGQLASLDIPGIVRVFQNAR